jgi:lambda family phage portal protein
MNVFPFLKRKKTVEPVTSPVVSPSQVSLRNVFQAAQADRFNNSWYRPVLSPNKELQFDYLRLKGIARYLVKNDVYAARYLELLTINVVGPQGVQLQPKVIDPATDEYNKPVNAELSRGWDDWCRSASIDGGSFIDLEQMVIRTVGQDGEVFVRFIVGPKQKYGLSLMLIDSDLLDINYNYTGLKNGNIIVQGIEKDLLGRVQAYHFWQRDPTDTNGIPNQRIRVPAEEVLHLYKPQRVSQARGFPWLTPAMVGLARLHSYIDAELIAAECGARQLGAIESAPTDIGGQGNISQDVIHLEQAELLQLAPGEKLTAWNNGHPSTAFDSFVKSILHGVASALSVSYSALASDAGAENYSGGRMSLLTERDHWKNIQSWFARSFHEKVFPLWLTCALETKSLALPTDDPSDYLNCSFRTRGWKWADPIKDAKANDSMIANNLASKTQIAAEAGLDWIEIINERYEELKLEAEHRKALEDAGLGQYLTMPIVPPNVSTGDVSQETATGIKPDDGID